jgi:hypothetical protein
MIFAQKSLDFHLPLTDSMSLIPVQLRFTDTAAWQPNPGKAFEFSPSATTELPLKPHDIADAAPDGHGFDDFDFSNYLKIH